MDFEFLSTTDKPALLGLTSPQYAEEARMALQSLGYKIHASFNHGDFIARFTRVQYQVVLFEELFDAALTAENLTLQNLQVMPMNQRRHAAVILIGDAFQTLDAMQAFARSVHAVVNPSEMFLLIQLIQKAVADNDMLLHTFRHAQKRLA